MAALPRCPIAISPPLPLDPMPSMPSPRCPSPHHSDMRLAAVAVLLLLHLPAAAAAPAAPHRTRLRRLLSAHPVPSSTCLHSSPSPNQCRVPSKPSQPSLHSRASTLREALPLFHTDSDDRLADQGMISNLGTSGSVSSSSSATSPAEKALAAILGVILALILVACCVHCVRKKRKRSSSGSSQLTAQEATLTPTATLPLPQMQQNHQLPELSSFTRISSTAEVVAALSSAHAASARSGAASSTGFSLARLLGKSKMGSKGASSVYLHHHFDHSLQKTPSLTPSNRSSSHGYFWDLSSNGKKYIKDKDGYPVITLTSPTNSETSIPLASHDDTLAISGHGTYGSSSSKGSSSSASALQCITTLESASYSLAGSSSSSPPESPPPTVHQPSSSYMFHQAVPQHMLLHPSFAYNKESRCEKQVAVLPSQTSHSMTDFPPTYEEAVDGAGPSTTASTCSRSSGQTTSEISSEPCSSASPLSSVSSVPLESPESPGSPESLGSPESPQRSLNVPSILLPGSAASAAQVGPLFHVSSPSIRRVDAPLYDAPTWSERNVDQTVWDPDADMSQDTDNDPLASLALRPTTSPRVLTSTD
ncbi:hypothetical protein B0O80DRAFT_262146 [Mortierella sp. GBAus27b]|nr:hypothetical protein B0O80DRAFT_262146 [Mortierella sp. GBAus27b]